MNVYKRYFFHFREHYSSGNFKNHFLDTRAYDVESAKEFALMGQKGKDRFEFIKDLTDFSNGDYTDYVIVHDTVPTLDHVYREAKRNINIKELLEDEPNN